MSDLIDRQSVLKVLEDMHTLAVAGVEKRSAVYGLINGYTGMIRCKVKQLPSAEPEPSQVARDIARIVENEKDMRILPKTGHWIIYTVSPFDGEDVKCSECGQCGCAPYWDYCPNCGARMEETT